MVACGPKGCKGRKLLKSRRVLYYNDGMKDSRGISHDWDDESLEAKARWFQSLTIEERMELLCEFTDLALSVNPSLLKEKKHAEPAPGRVQVISLPDDDLP